LAARIVAGAEAYEVALAEGAAARELNPLQALARVRRGARTRYDPAVVDVLQALVTADDGRDLGSVAYGRAGVPAQARRAGTRGGFIG
jgi:HD-GYP domain-containing protein (c-di-GMP phosphodiesterase class II)